MSLEQHRESPQTATTDSEISRDVARLKEIVARLCELAEAGLD